MKNRIVKCAIVGLAMIAGIAVAGMEITGRATFTGTGAGPEIVIKEHDGSSIRNILFMVNLETNATISIRRPANMTWAWLALSASTNLWVHTDSSNVIGGVTVTTSDYFVLEHSGSSGYQLVLIDSIGTYSNATKKTLYGLTSSKTIDANDRIFLADDGDKVDISPGTSQLELKNLFTGFLGMPVVIDVPASAGDGVFISGTVDYEK